LSTTGLNSTKTTSKSFLIDPDRGSSELYDKLLFINKPFDFGIAFAILSGVAVGLALELKSEAKY
jgi:hypothetical protein